MYFCHNKAIIYLNGYIDPTGVDFLIRPVVSPTHFDVVLAINIEANWIKAHIHYIASSREDLKCGSFAVSDNELFETHTNSGRKLRATYSLPDNQWANLRTKIIPFTYISGIKSEDQSFSLKLNQVETILSNNVLYVSILISNNTKPI